MDELLGHELMVELMKHALVYAGGLYIESTEGYGADIESQGKWYLILERDEWISDDLTDLEAPLYGWGIQAGNIEGTAE